MDIRQVTADKENYRPLLLIGDEQESLIRGYLGRGELFAAERDGEVLGVCVVTREGTGLYEVQNIAVAPKHQRKGIGRALMEFVWERYPDLKVLRLGTGDSPSTVGFYRAMGFQERGREKDHFLKYYDHPIYEDGKQLRDRILFQREKAP